MLSAQRRAEDQGVYAGHMDRWLLTVEDIGRDGQGYPDDSVELDEHGDLLLWLAMVG